MNEKEMKGTFPTFRGLLRGAICNRSQAQFASEAGISAEHLNRMLNGKSINRPSKTTLQKLASAAMNGIRYQDFVNALDNDEGTNTEQDEDVKTGKDAEPFEVFAEQLYASLAEAFGKESPQLYDSVEQYLEKVFGSIENGSKICYDLSLIRPYFGDREEFAKIPGISYAQIDFSVLEEKNLLSDQRVAKSSGILYLTENEIFAGKVLIYGVAMDNRALFDVNGLVPEMFNGEEERRAFEKAESEDGLENVLGRKYNITITKVLPSRRKRSATEFLDLILAEHSRENSMLRGVCGLGFETKNIRNECLGFFLKSHRKIVLQAAKRFDADLKKLENAIMEDRSVGLMMTEVADLWPNRLQDESARDCVLGIVSCVMWEETGFNFEFYRDPMRGDDPKLVEIYKDFLQDMEYIVIDNETIERQNIRQNTLLNVIAKYCRELDVSVFGEMRFYTIESGMGKPTLYRISKQDVITENEVPVNTDDWKESTKEPKETGMHEFLLKDGRILRGLFLKNPDKNHTGIWLARHKDFSKMVDKWNPEQLMIEK